MIRVGVNNKKDKWIAVAYHANGIEMEIAIADSKENACLELASKLLSRLHELGRVIDKNKGSVKWGSGEGCISLVDETSTLDFKKY